MNSRIALITFMDGSGGQPDNTLPGIADVSVGATDSAARRRALARLSLRSDAAG